MMANLSVDSVSFSGVLKSYPPGEKLEVAYSLHDDLTPASRDWVGLFRVGWSSSRDYYTFEWSPTPNGKKGSVVFAGRRLPPQDKHFYQFCYVSSDGRVRGASPPFQFSSTAAHDNMEDLELVEVSEDSIMILQVKETAEASPEKAGLEKELVSVKESVTKLESERESLIAKFEMVELDGAKKSEQLDQLEEKVADLERQLQAKRESETRLMEKLEKERALAHELTATCSNEEAQVTLLRQQLQEKEAALTQAQGTNDALKEEVAELRSHSEETEEKLAKQTAEMSQLQEMQVDLMSQIGDKNEEFERQVSKFDELHARYEQETQVLRSEKDQLLQEVTIAQQNIAELLGARREGVVVNAALVNNQEPPTLPATQINMVDKSAYEALQQAYENIEELYHKCREENREWRTRFLDMRAKHDNFALKNAELEQRIVKCRDMYEAKCVELNEARRNLQGGGGSLTEVTALQNRVREMEENQQQVTQSWEIATKELAARKEELKQKDIIVAEVEEKHHAIVQVLESVKNEFSEFQDKHDKVINEKRAGMDHLEATIGGLGKEKAKLEHTVKQLREQLESLKQQARSSERACPVCNTKFPGRISQQDFEKHVQGHFSGV